MAQVFISYSRKDDEFVRKLGSALAGQKREAWIDWKDIPPTAEWQEEIFRNIDAADHFVFVISPDSVVSGNCRKEIDHAAISGKRMVPIFYRAVQNEAIPEALNKFQRIDFSGDDHFDTKLAALIAALDTEPRSRRVKHRVQTAKTEHSNEGSIPSIEFLRSTTVLGEITIRQRHVAK